jgi:excisionase family DNA binding protein
MAGKRFGSVLDIQTYSPDRVAELLSVSRRHVFNMIGRGELRYSKLGGRTVIRHADLIGLLQRTSRGGWKSEEEALPAAE